MGDVIYWQKFDEPKIVMDRGMQVEASGQWVCDDDRVDTVEIIGIVRPTDTSKVFIGLEMTMKDGTRYSDEIEATKNTPLPLEEIIARGEKYLELLNKQSK